VSGGRRKTGVRFPLHRTEKDRRERDTGSGTTRTSREVGSTPEPCMSDDPQPIGLPAARRRDLFPCPTSASSTDRPPTLSSRVHALVPFLPFGVSSSILPPPPFGGGRPAGVPSLFATSPKVSTHAEASRAPATFRPQAFAASRRLAPPSATRACFIPQPRPGFLLRPGVSPDPQPSRLVTGRCLHAFVDHPLAGKPAATRDRLGFEALLCESMRSSRRGLAAPSVAPLFGFSPPPGSHAAIVSRAHPVVRS
jgi:hypothetical protein